MLGARGEALIKSFEGYRGTAYQDQGGIWTCGWGHTAPDVGPTTTCTLDQAEQWFMSDTASACGAVSRSVYVATTQNQFDAMVSLCYNIGAGNFSNSTLARDMNAHNYAAAAAEFPKWDRVAGVPNAGLLRRRLAEQQLFESVA